MKFPKVTPRSSGTVPVATASGPMLEDRKVEQVPWYRGSRLHRKGEGMFLNPFGVASVTVVEIPPEVVEAKRASLPAPIRRTAKQRAEAFATDLFKVALQTREEYGRVVWPASIERELVGLGADKKPAQEQVEALTLHYMSRTENQQRAQDAKRITLDWHGHYD